MSNVKIRNQVIKNHVNAFNSANGGIKNDNLKIIVAYKVENKVLFVWKNDEGEYCINEIIQGKVSHMPIETAESKEEILCSLSKMM